MAKVGSVLKPSVKDGSGRDELVVHIIEGNLISDKREGDDI